MAKRKSQSELQISYHLRREKNVPAATNARFLDEGFEDNESRIGIREEQTPRQTNRVRRE
ncbi:MAG: hypothetical protein M3R69_11330 [Acidobacteriota bacterium]|nr:hypothetical protein [Acidobacteriota bacterium]